MNFNRWFKYIFAQLLYAAGYLAKNALVELLPFKRSFKTQFLSKYRIKLLLLLLLLLLFYRHRRHHRRIQRGSKVRRKKTCLMVYTEWDYSTPSPLSRPPHLIVTQHVPFHGKLRVVYRGGGVVVGYDVNDGGGPVPLSISTACVVDPFPFLRPPPPPPPPLADKWTVVQNIAVGQQHYSTFTVLRRWQNASKSAGCITLTGGGVPSRWVGRCPIQFTPPES